MSHVQVWTAREPGGDGVTVFGAKLPDATGVLLGTSRDIREFVGGDDLAYILQEVLKNPPPAAYVGSSDSIGCVPSARGVGSGLSVNE